MALREKGVASHRGLVNRIYLLRIPSHLTTHGNSTKIRKFLYVIFIFNSSPSGFDTRLRHRERFFLFFHHDDAIVVARLWAIILMEFGNSNDLRDPYLNAAIVACYEICMVIGMSINHHTILWLIMLRPIEAFESFKLNTLDYHCFSIFVTILRF